MSDLIGIIIITLLGFIAYSFGDLVAGRRKGDAELIKRLYTEVEMLKGIIKGYEKIND